MNRSYLQISEHSSAAKKMGNRTTWVRGEGRGRERRGGGRRGGGGEGAGGGFSGSSSRIPWGLTPASGGSRNRGAGAAIGVPAAVGTETEPRRRAASSPKTAAARDWISACDEAVGARVPRPAKTNRICNWPGRGLSSPSPVWKGI